MIDKAAFKREWRGLAGRFGREADEEQARRYYAFLSPIMGTAEFEEAARSLWASARFFPRPADFLLQRQARDWLEVQALLGSYRAPWPDGKEAAEWWEAWRALPAAARGAAEALGGPEAAKEALERVGLKLRAEWERAYEQEATRAAVAALGPGGGARLLTGGGAE